MWIRRSFNDDQLYIAVVQAYIDTLLSGGFNFECFVGEYSFMFMKPKPFTNQFTQRVDDLVLAKYYHRNLVS